MAASASEQKYKKLVDKVKKGIKLLKESHAKDYLCDEGEEMFKELAKEVGVNTKEFDEEDLNFIEVGEDGGEFKIDPAFVKNVMSNDELECIEDVIEWLNENITDYKLAILDKNDKIIMRHIDTGCLIFGEPKEENSAAYRDRFGGY